MDRAFAATRFMFLKRALLQPFAGVHEEMLTVAAQRVSWFVFVTAKAPDHDFHGPGFSLHTF